ncbi:MAG: LysE family translocator [Pseudomonadota bacterium]
MITTEFLITSLIVVLIPGTGVIYTISMGLFRGTKASALAALGCTAGIIPSLLACVVGLAAVIHTSALLFQVIKYIGVAYLLYLAWSMWREAGALSVNEESGETDWWKISLRGFLINILNPKLTLFFLAFLPQFIPANIAQPLPHMLLLGGIFMAMTLAVFLLYGLLANSLRSLILDSPTAARYLQRVFAGSFALLGAKLALTER